MVLDICYNGCNGLVDTTLEVHRISTCGDVLQSNVHDALCEDGGGGCSVAGVVTSLAGYALHELGACVLKVVLEFNLLSHCHSVLCNLGSTKFLLNNHVAALRTECHLDCISQLVNALLQQFAGVGIEFYFFCHNTLIL